MKWIKHPTNLLDEDDAQAILDKHGYAGIYAYIKMIEYLGLRFDPEIPGIFLLNKRNFFSKLFPKVCKRTGKNMLDFFQKLRIIDYDIKNKDITITCQLIKELADEYTKKCLKKKK